MYNVPGVSPFGPMQYPMQGAGALSSMPTAAGPNYGMLMSKLGQYFLQRARPQMQAQNPFATQAMPMQNFQMYKYSRPF